MSELPAGWCFVPLSELADTIRGVTYNKAQARDEVDEGLLPIIRANNIKSGGLAFNDLVYVPADYVSERQMLRRGDIVVAMSSGSRSVVGKTAQLIVPWQGSFGAFCGVLRAKSNVDSDYLYRFTQSVGYRDLVSELAAGVNINNLKPSHFDEIEVPLAPLREQKRIAQKLDTLLAQIDNLKARIDAVPALLKRFRQSVLNAAVDGSLSEEWRNSHKGASNGKELHCLLRELHEVAGGHARGNASDPSDEAHDLSIDDIPPQWDIAVLRDICEPGRPITYGILKPGPELENGIPYIRVADFPGNKLKLEGIKKTSEEIDRLFKRARLRAGDLLLSIRGSVGRLIMIPAELEGANITQDTARLSISAAVSTNYIYWALLAESTQRRMRAATRGVAVRGINIGDVRALQVPLPSRDEQNEIVRRVEQLFAFADQLEAKIATARQRIDSLTQSLLAKAFRGELVPQDPNDEPASVLLERIRAQRAVTPQSTRGRKAATNRKDAMA